MALVAIAVVVQYWPVFLAGAVITAVVWIAIKIFGNGGAQSAASVTKESFGVSIEPRASVSSVSNVLTFHETETSVRIGNFHVPAFLLYVGDVRGKLPHLVRPDLKIGSPGGPRSMGYWPNYESISPNDRAAYIDWLANGRSNPATDIGYVFLYFYGLEYRAIAEGKNHPEIFSELIRLFRIYGERNNSFKGYCSDFIIWLVLKNPGWTSSELAPLHDLIEGDSSRYAEQFAEVRHRLHGGNFNFDFLYGYIDQIAPLKLKFLRNSEQKFKTLLRGRLGEGPFDYSFTSKQESWSYKTATSLNLDANLQYPVVALLSSEPLVKAWLDALSDLKTYASVRLASSPFALEISSAPTGSDLGSLVPLLRLEGHQIISLRELGEIAGVYVPIQPSISYSRKFRDGWASWGLSIEPDPDLDGRAYKASADVVLFRQTGEPIREETFKRAILLFDLGISVAMADGIAHDAECKHVTEFVCQHFKLSKSESQRIKFRSTLYREGKLKAGNFRKFPKELTPSDADAVGKFLVAIAALDGVLEPTEMKALEKIFKTMELPAGTLEKLIAEITATPGVPVILKQASASKRQGSPIPREQEAKSNADIKKIVIDPVALKNAFAEAEQVSRVLANVFKEEEQTEAVTEPVVVAPLAPNPSAAKIEFSSLSDSERELMRWLVSQESWEQIEVDKKCRSLKLMYGAAITKLNNWSEAKHGDLLIEEDGETVTINAAIVNKSEVQSA